MSEANASPLSKRDATGTWPIRVVDWVTGNYTMSGWINMGSGSSWQRGDVIAKRIDYTDASGHCGIAVSNSEVVAAGIQLVSRGGHGLR